MSVITVNSLVDKTSRTLQDTGATRWTSAELIEYLNDGQRDATLLLPSVSVMNAAVQLLPGATKQALPDGGFMLIDIPRNMGAAGSTPGTVIRSCSREVLDSQRPSWHSDTNVRGRIENFIYDPQDPKTYYVYPKAPNPWFVQIVCSVSPVTAVAGGVISIDDLYANALYDYMLYRAYSKDSEVAQNEALAAAHNQLFRTALGVKPIYQNGVPRQ